MSRTPEEINDEAQMWINKSKYLMSVVNSEMNTISNEELHQFTLMLKEFTDNVNKCTDELKDLDR